MLDKTEYLLICLAEELGEVQKEIHKCLRFGLNHKPSNESTTNFDRVLLEWSDVVGLLEALKEQNVHIESNSEQVDAKLVRTEKYYEISKKLGVSN